MFLDCAKTDHNDLYKVMLGAIVPRPIAWVSTQSKHGINNLAPFSFFNGFGVDPPMVGFAPGYRSITETDDGIVRVPKDTLRNVEETKEFVVNIVSRSLAERMNQTSEAFDSQTSEFDVAGLTAAPCRLIGTPRVAESMINFECRLIEVFRYGNNNLVLGEVVGIHLNDDVVNERFHIDADVLQAVGRMAGNWYATTEDRFELKRPSS